MPIRIQHKNSLNEEEMHILSRLDSTVYVQYAEFFNTLCISFSTPSTQPPPGAAGRLGGALRREWGRGCALCCKNMLFSIRFLSFLR